MTVVLKIAVTVLVWCSLWWVSTAGVCPNDVVGYLCLEGQKDKYYECSAPLYVGFRDCPGGTQCVDVSVLHPEIPCKTVSDTSSGKGDKSGSSSKGNPDNSKDSSRKQTDDGVSLRTWWVWAVMAASAFGVAILGWIGYVTWPGTQERLDVVFKHHLG